MFSKFSVYLEQCVAATGKLGASIVTVSYVSKDTIAYWTSVEFSGLCLL